MWFRKKPDPEPEKTLEEQLIEARASLAAHELLPEGDFTILPTVQHPLIAHGVDEKVKVIARDKARIARLEVLVKGGRNVSSK